MADNDHGVDLSFEASELLLNFFKKEWRPGKGHKRSNEYNWTHSENVAYALEDLGFSKSPALDVSEDWIPFLEDVKTGLVVVLKEKGFTNKLWRKNCQYYLKMLERMIKTASNA